MAERPILFSDPMVRAILDGRKLQTRRVLTPQPHEESGPISVGRYHPIVVRRGLEEPGVERFGAHTDDESWPCPYGAPGDRLWVREAWSYYGGDEYLYQRDPMAVGFRASADFGGRPIPGGRWRPSIHMPRWASRLTLEVTSVRVERVQSIGEFDALAEGVSGWVRDRRCETARDGFRVLWDSINGKRDGCSWKANPWVWAITFKLAGVR